MDTSALPEMVWFDRDEAHLLNEVEMAVHPARECKGAASAEDGDLIVTLIPRLKGKAGTYMAARADRDNLQVVVRKMLRSLQLTPPVYVSFAGLTPDEETMASLTEAGHDRGPLNPPTPSPRSRDFANQVGYDLYPMATPEPETSTEAATH